MCLLGDRIFSFHIFSYFSPKIVKIKPDMGQFQAKMLKHEIQVISENTQPNVVKI